MAADEWKSVSGWLLIFAIQKAVGPIVAIGAALRRWMDFGGIEPNRLSWPNGDDRQTFSAHNAINNFEMYNIFFMDLVL
jgi:hypothetical protein